MEPGIGGGRVEGYLVLWGLGLVLWAYGIDSIQAINGQNADKIIGLRVLITQS